MPSLPRRRRHVQKLGEGQPGQGLCRQKEKRWHVRAGSCHRRVQQACQDHICGMLQARAFLLRPLQIVYHKNN